MKKIALLSAIAAASIATGASAQSTTGIQPYVGATIAHHDLGVGGLADDNGMTYGGLVGVEIPAGDTLKLGFEANYSAGTSAIDSEYGIAAKVGMPIGSGSQVFVKGGWQWVDLDLRKATGVSPIPAGLDDTIDDYVLGVGAELGTGVAGGKLRVGVDTVSFDSVRPYAGLIWKF